MSSDLLNEMVPPMTDRKSWEGITRSRRQVGAKHSLRSQPKMYEMRIMGAPMMTHATPHHNQNFEGDFSASRA